ncbi:MAG: phenylalanine--tRNA ligase subunit beta [Gammaproteobacteria bacterium]|nr:phenylalanine--tRNA ligase subunit beta [Gammaproteobacteria bacterium]
MKVPYAWLTEWIDVPWDAATLGERLTMAGLELESITPAAAPFTGVLVGEILSAEKHPQADKLRICRVATGQGEPLQIVCGAPNARAGLKSALAVVGAVLPEGLKIKAAKLRGAESAGMLCSPKELGLAEDSDGILELPADAPTGAPLREYLQLDDVTLDLNVTPNRGDALSILGVARDVAALSGRALKIRTPHARSPGHGDTVTVHLDAPAGCPRFAGCVLRGVDNTAPTPIWMRERLRRAGVRSISPVVDVTNYVMLELGQPMHAYDLAQLQGPIRVRQAAAGESITLLDGRSVELAPDVLLITDAAGPVGIAGIMGGERTAVSAGTTDVFLEVAYFAPDAVIGRALRWGLSTDASQRFERGVNPAGQAYALERALELMQRIAGGTAGPLTLTESEEDRPARPPVVLRRSQLGRLLGAQIPDERVCTVLENLGMRVQGLPEGWEVGPPAHRFDIALEADLIEEVARIVGYEAIEERDALAAERVRALPEFVPMERAVLELLATRGYQEAITYAFVDPQLQQQLFGDRSAPRLANPIASDLSVMRVSLWPGLLGAALENQRRQRDRIRLFEHGARFEQRDGVTHEIETLSAVACGPRMPEQWGLPRPMREAADFFDVKGDLEVLLAAVSPGAVFSFVPGEHPSLHPGRSARVLRAGEPVGWVGELHPSLVRDLQFVHTPVLFELDWAALALDRPAYREISRQPQVRRDLAVVVDESVPLSRLAERVALVGSSLLRDLRVFDVYRGPGIEDGRKSVALGLIFQDFSRTLTDDDVARLVAAVVADLRVSFNASIRE